MIFCFSWPKITHHHLFPSIFFLNKVVILQDLGFHLFFIFLCFSFQLFFHVLFIILVRCMNGCRRLSALCYYRRLGATCGAAFICVDDSDEQNISNQQQEIKSMIVNILHNFNHRYFSHNINIKCLD